MPKKKSPYYLEISQEVKSEIDRLPGNIRQRVKRLILQLLDNPYPPETKELSTADGKPLGVYRIKIDTWRLVYLPNDDLLIVELLKVGRKHGPEFYDSVLARLGVE